MYVVIALESLNINSLLFAFDINLYYFIFMYWVFFCSEAPLPPR